MILLDTTVLAYAVGTEHRFRDPCRDLVGAIAAGRIEATTTPEVIQEFVRIRSRRRDRAEAASLGLSHRSLLTPLTGITENHLVRGIELFERSNSLGAFDSVLAAVAIDMGMTLVSAGSAFGTVTGLNHIVPDRDGIRSLIPPG